MSSEFEERPGEGADDWWAGERANGRERPARYSAQSHSAAAADESPDLLRWRADLLLDEMMLGGADVSAADARGRSPASDPGAPQLQPELDSDPPPSRPAYPTPRPAAGSFAEELAGSPLGDSTPFDPEPDDPPRASQLHSHFEGPRTPADERPLGRPGGEAGGPPAELPNGAGSGHSERLYSLEQRYEAFRRELESTVKPVPLSTPPAPATPPPPPPLPAPDEQTRWANTPEKWNWQDFGAAPGEQADPAASLLYAPAESVSQPAVSAEPSPYVSAMAMLPNGRKRSTLLPRMSTLDVDALNREIAALHGEIGSLLPVGNEAGERARHLLDKAYSIVQSDPSRSAEVEYYMQQVRTIVQRLRQARRWSDLYRDRLRMYLSAWLLLAFLLLAARYLFQPSLERLMAGLFNAAADSLFVEHVATLVGAVAAGTLGGALGALLTMSQHMRSEHSFFDRKYGLRGLMLPIIPALIGGLGYLLVGAFYIVLELNPAANWVAGLLPVLAAFAFGFSQESIYGTRG
jgi:hypothetical protein